jgi:endonuclease/exonuclease/phosphatase family metal-dependent hydrolase
MRAFLLLLAFLPAVALADDAPRTVRFATYNGSLYDDEGKLVERLRGGDEHARQVAAVVQHVRPDVLLLNEFDYDERGDAAGRFLRDYLGKPQHGQQSIAYRYHYLAPVNTGVPSGLDIDGDGKADGPADAWGFGRHPGQYGMLVLSRFPIDAKHARTFRLLPWHRMPGALAPKKPDGTPFYDAATWKQLRLSSKSHWDLPIDTPIGVVHFLVHHPTPPVFDGPDDHNGLRNHDEIRLWADYVSGDRARASWIVDDGGRAGGIDAGAAFVVAGDHNADPNDGEAVDHAVRQLLDNPAIDASEVPRSDGAAEAARREGGANATQHGDPANDTGEFGPKIGNLRIDFVLPSRGLRATGSGVFWPVPGTPEAAYSESSDHHLVWLDLAAPHTGR